MAAVTGCVARCRWRQWRLLGTRERERKGEGKDERMAGKNGWVNDYIEGKRDRNSKMEGGLKECF